MKGGGDQKTTFKNPSFIKVKKPESIYSPIEREIVYTRVKNNKNSATSNRCSNIKSFKLLNHFL